MSALDPPHPGSVVRRECLEAHGLSVTEGARILRVTRQALNNLVNQKAALSPEMAVRLAKAFNGSEEEWLKLQLAYDLARIRKQAHTITVRPMTEHPEPVPQPRLL